MEDRIATVTTLDPLEIDDWTTEGIALGLVGILVIVGLTSVLVHRFLSQKKPSGSDDTSMTRPILALVLVGTVVILAAASLTMEEKQTRNLLIGGVISLSSAAVAFYFASSGATEVRRDLLKSTGGAVVPDLVGKTFSDAQAIVSRLPSLGLVAPADAIPGAAIVAQEPPAGTTALAGTTITVTF